MSKIQEKYFKKPKNTRYYPSLFFRYHSTKLSKEVLCGGTCMNFQTIIQV